MSTSMMTLAEAAAVLGAPPPLSNPSFDGVCTDSRQVQPGTLFIALKGENFDAHDFVVDLLTGKTGAVGAVAAVVEADFAVAHPELPLIAVHDTRLALGALAADWRGRFAIPLIGVTGSNGKTTVKEMCASILRAHFGQDAVLATAGNLNNEIGLPLTLLQLRPHHRAAVIEMGMNHAGEIDYLTRLAAPTVAIVNNAQRAHLEGLGSVQDVARAKGEIFSGVIADVTTVPQPGFAVFNADDAQCGIWQQLTRNLQQLCFGLDHEAEVRGDFTPHGFGGLLRLTTPGGPLALNLGVPGRHNARNACAAAAATLAAGVPGSAVVRGLEAFTGVKGRLQRRAGRQGALIIDDSYNANPDSMRAALDVLAGIPGRRIFVMGDMGEAGKGAGQFHDEIGGYAKSHGIDRLLTLGELSVAAARNFGEGGSHFARVEELIKTLLGELNAQTTVLVKGSRFMRMERVVEAMAEDPS